MNKIQSSINFLIRQALLFTILLGTQLSSATALKPGKFISESSLTGMKIYPNQQHVHSQGIDSFFLEKMILPTNYNSDYLRLSPKVKTIVNFRKEYHKIHGKFFRGLFEETWRTGIPKKVLVSMFEAFRHDITFLGNFKLGDSYEILYEMPTSQEKRDKSIDFFLACLFLSKRKHVILKFKPRNNRWGYYSDKGEHIIRTRELLRIPIRDAYITSYFGRRYHPILKKSRDHQGLDFAAPIGMPVMAARDGIIEKVSRGKSYGRYVHIRHNRNYATIYAHLSKVAHGIQKGKKICQSQVVGYVGKTGLSTGPHLHYEVLYKGRRVNPSHLHVITREQLTYYNLQDLIFYKKCLEEICHRLRNIENL